MKNYETENKTKNFMLSIEPSTLQRMQAINQNSGLGRKVNWSKILRQHLESILSDIESQKEVNGQ